MYKLCTMSCLRSVPLGNLKVPYSPVGRIVVTKDPGFTDSSRIMSQFMIGDGGAEEMFFRC